MQRTQKYGRSPPSCVVGSLAAWRFPVEGNGAVCEVVVARDAVLMRQDVAIPWGGGELRKARVRVSTARVAAMTRPVDHLPAKEGGVARAARPGALYTRYKRLGTRSKRVATRVARCRVPPLPAVIHGLHHRLV
eukprot:scaffold24376_cov78-Phaeocystis_antarctica.AAC.3